MKFSGLIFDFNGVLWWDSEIQVKAWKEFSKALRGEPLNDEEFDVHVHGRNGSHTIEYLLGRTVSEKDTDTHIQSKEKIYRELCLAEGEGFVLSEGAQELLDFLKDKKIPITIATASEKTNLNFFIKQLDLDRWFNTNTIAYDDGKLPGKPAPDIYLRAAKNIGLAPKDCVVIEDSISGIQAAKNAGIGYIIGLAPEDKRKKLMEVDGVDQVLENLSFVNRQLFED